MRLESCASAHVDAAAKYGQNQTTTLPLQEHSVATGLGRKNRPRGGFFISGPSRFAELPLSALQIRDRISLQGGSAE